MKTLSDIISDMDPEQRRNLRQGAIEPLADDSDDYIDRQTFKAGDRVAFTLYGEEKNGTVHGCDDRSRAIVFVWRSDVMRVQWFHANSLRHVR